MPRGKLWILSDGYCKEIPEAMRADSRGNATGKKEAIYEIGTEWCAAQCADLLRHGVPAVHFYTMGKPRNISAIMRKCF